MHSLLVTVTMALVPLGGAAEASPHDFPDSVLDERLQRVNADWRSTDLEREMSAWAVHNAEPIVTAIRERYRGLGDRPPTETTEESERQFYAAVRLLGLTNSPAAQALLADWYLETARVALRSEPYSRMREAALYELKVRDQRVVGFMLENLATMDASGRGLAIRYLGRCCKFEDSVRERVRDLLRPPSVFSGDRGLEWAIERYLEEPGSALLIR